MAWTSDHTFACLRHARSSPDPSPPSPVSSERAMKRPQCCINSPNVLFAAKNTRKLERPYDIIIQHQTHSSDGKHCNILVCSGYRPSNFACSRNLSNFNGLGRATITINRFFENCQHNRSSSIGSVYLCNPVSSRSCWECSNSCDYQGSFLDHYSVYGFQYSGKHNFIKCQ